MKSQLLLLCLSALTLAASAARGAEAPPIRNQEIQVKLSPMDETIEGVCQIYLAAEAREIEFALHRDLTPTAGNRGWVMQERPDDDADDGLRLWRMSAGGGAPGEAALEIRYGGGLYQDVSGTSFSREKVGGEISATVGMDGVYLAGGAGWYPQFGEGLWTYRVTAILPRGWVSVTQGWRGKDLEQGDWTVQTWNGERPSDGANLVANRFRVDSRDHGGTAVETYFFPEDSTLSTGYLDACERFLDIYEEMLGPYPFQKFAVVENFFPTGYGMPSWTLLGQRVLQLPFIKDTSLGHEIAHNWWGNSVYVGEGGNWCEGLTTYTADYHYKMIESPELGRQYRKDLLRDYTRYTHAGGDFPLAEFVSRHDSATRAVGYGKSMMVFHMLEEMAGEKAFRAALRRVIAERQWGEAVWSDFFRAVETEAGLAPMSLEPEREQWIDGTGAARLVLGEVAVSREGAGWMLRGTIAQESEPLLLRVPLHIETAAGPVEARLDVAGPTTRFEIAVPGKPEALIVDPDYHLFRRLYEEEMESTLSLILSDEDPLFVLESGLSPGLESAFRDFASAWVEGEPRIVPADSRDESARTLIWLGTRPPDFRDPPEGLTLNRFFAMFQSERFEPESYAIVYTGKRGEGRGFMALIADSPAEVRAASSKVPHYGKYSYLAFTAGRNRVKGNWDAAAGPLRRDLD